MQKIQNTRRTLTIQKYTHYKYTEDKKKTTNTRIPKIQIQIIMQKIPFKNCKKKQTIP